MATNTDGKDWFIGRKIVRDTLDRIEKQFRVITGLDRATPAVDPPTQGTGTT
jgi:hypothetical protein